MLPALRMSRGHMSNHYLGGRWLGQSRRRTDGRTSQWAGQPPLLQKDTANLGHRSWVRLHGMAGSDDQLGFGFVDMGAAILYHPVIASLDRAIALHARSLTFLHPVRYEPLTLTADLPRGWRGRFAHLLREVPR